MIRAPALRRQRGTLIAVPVVNVYGFVRQSRYLPDRRDLNRSFPGSEKGSLAARLANAFLEEIVANADYGIDLHTGAVHFLQIWLEPNRRGVEPEHDQQHFPIEQRRGRLVLFVSPDGRFDSIATHQDALLYGTLLRAGEALEHQLKSGRRAYVHIACGQVGVNGQTLHQGDGLAVEDQPVLRFEGIEASEILLFDLP